ncbi:hypothetical protein RRF57_012407 [Xylaria bambusicola]|uniref:Uncharacterized protein n=1 Tax=Xylaria bambusicola TaxID=326684 RepID=A0AAN7Z4H7_9PEZI
MYPSQRRGLSKVDVRRRWSTSCLEDAAFGRAYHSLVLNGLVKTALEQQQARSQFSPWVHCHQPPPSSPQDVRESSIPLHALSRGPYGSNWRTLLQPTSRPPPELPSPLEASHEGVSNGRQPRRPPLPPPGNNNRRRLNKRRDQIDPHAAARNAETLRRRRSRTFCGPHMRDARVREGEASTAQFSTNPPNISIFGDIEFLSLEDAVENTSGANGGEQSMEKEKEKADSSSDERDSDDDDEEEEGGSDGDDCEDVLEVLDGYDRLEDFEDEELQASWDPFWPEHRDGAR